MTFKDQFVVEVKADGQILRVRDGAVYLPFGCEYSILLKNLNSRKASVKVTIDSEDVLDGHSLILDPLVTHELQGFLRGTTAKNRFRFIQKTKEIQEHRGDKVGDGLVRVEFAFEKPRPQTVVKKIITEVEEHHHHHHHDHDYYWPRPWRWYEGPGWTHINDTVYSSTSDQMAGSSGDSIKGACGSMGDSGGGGEPMQTFMSNCNDVSRSIKSGNVTCDSLGVQASFTAHNAPDLDEGITVKGNQMHEQYMYGMVGDLEQSSVIVIVLKGMQRSSGTVVQDPVTVTTKLTCSTCGTKCKSSSKYCSKCGTFLE